MARSRHSGETGSRDPARPESESTAPGPSRADMEGAREGVLLTDTAGTVAYVNPALLAQVGLDADTLAGRDIGSVIAVRDEVFDPVTGLSREPLLAERAGPMLALARRKDRSVAVARVAVSVLVRGRAPADPAVEGEALRAVAGRLAAAVRDTDVVARLADGDFVLIMQEVMPDESLGRAAERILARVCEPLLADGEAVDVGARLGAALFPRDASGWAELLERAAAALARAAGAGRDFAFFEEGLTVRSRDRLRLEAEFTQAADASELLLHYQPVVATETGRMVGAEALARGQVMGIEALARWPHRDRGLVPPGEFIPLAEATGRILSLDRWAVATAIRQASTWWDRGWTGWVSVNLSTRSVRDPDIADYVGDLLASRGIPPDRLILEITESAAMRDPDATLAVLHSLKDVGVRLAIDDFGTGHSSLVYLKRLPVDFIKLDRGFITDLGTDSRDRWLVESIVALAHRIGALIIAEGVEKQEDLDWLRSAGCDLVQGFLVGRPAPASELDPSG